MCVDKGCLSRDVGERTRDRLTVRGGTNLCTKSVAPAPNVLERTRNDEVALHLLAAHYGTGFVGRQVTAYGLYSHGLSVDFSVLPTLAYVVPVGDSCGSAHFN